MGDVDRLMEIWLAGNLEAHAFIDAQHWRRHADATKHALGQMALPLRCWCMKMRWAYAAS